ncbi:aldose 1-epimerase [Erysipelotrichaceae bacterium]|nr:aldose 1-epimerase [Erysipelotrichaceae bacterium]
MMKTIQIENSEIKLELLTIGACIYKCETKNRDGVFENIVLNFADKKEYEKPGGPNFGVVVGRVAGRIRNGSFNLGETKYILPQNDGSHHLHGGLGYGLCEWMLIEHTTKSVTFLLEDADGNQGYPGAIKTTVCYKLDGNMLIIQYDAISNEQTLWDPTQHSYWNLSGACQEPILNQYLQISANSYIPLDEIGMVRDEIHPVEGTIFDVRKAKLIADIIASTDEQISFGSGGYDHPFVLNHKHEKVAKLLDPISGRMLSITTDKPAIIVYMACKLGSEYTTSIGKKTEKYAGICLETQHIPNAINAANGSEIPIIEPNEIRKSTTIIEFGIY